MTSLKQMIGTVHRCFHKLIQQRQLSTASHSLQSIIRFIDDEGIERYGDGHNISGETFVVEKQGEDFQCTSYSRTNTTAKIQTLLAPLKPTTIIGIGLNYRAHALETKQVCIICFAFQHCTIINIIYRTYRNIL